MNNRFRQLFRLIVLAFAAIVLCASTKAQSRNPGSGSGYGQLIVSKDIHHDRSKPLREIVPSTTVGHISAAKLAAPTSMRPMSAPGEVHNLTDSNATHLLFNGSTGVETIPVDNQAGLGEFFTGPQGAFVPTAPESDATGAVGTTQYLQWVDASLAVFNKASGNAVYGPVPGNTIWSGFGGACEADNDGQPTVNFDKLAQRWVVSQYAKASGPPYVQCVAVSTSADATGTWNRYSFQTGGYEVNSFVNENAKLGVWPDGYYMAFDMYSGSTFEGDRICALERANMIAGYGAEIQCVQLEPDYYGVVVGDLDGLTPPPTGAPAYFAAEDTYVFAIDFWKFHVDWNDSQNSTLSLPILLGTGSPAQACTPYSFTGVCVPQYGTSVLLDSYAGRLTGRMPYRNYGNYQSLFATETDGSAPTPSGGPTAPTAVRFYETRLTNSGDLYMYQAGTFAPDNTNFRFLPSIASDRAGNIAVTYNFSNPQDYPGQYMASRAAGDPLNTLGNEVLLNPGNASQTTTSLWDERATLTVDPVDDCTYWYTQQYIPQPGSTQWVTLIAAFYLSGCQASTVTLQTSPSGLAVNLNGTAGMSPLSQQVTVGNSVSIGTTSPQAGATGTQYVFAGWSDNGAIIHNITVPGTATTYTANFTTQYKLTTGVSPAGGGTVSVASGGFYNAGSTVNLIATAATGYAFAGWTGAVANPKSASTTIVMKGPQAVVAQFTAIPIVHVSLTGKSGPTNARVWSFSFTNSGQAEGNGVTVTSFKLTQTAGTACSPTISTPIPEVVGNVAPGATITGNVVINFTGCSSSARFSLAVGHSVTGGQSYTANITNQSQ
jgi:uncharacterized repeat protein (TIGR02543 family)